jgi:hypothetical protein
MDAKTVDLLKQVILTNDQPAEPEIKQDTLSLLQSIISQKKEHSEKLNPALVNQNENALHSSYCEK